ncbi:MAG: hypothetical protein M3273_02420 [Actinomycetota bacterium]|nr:hypothetical protein [Actinomycetota bacterium]
MTAFTFDGTENRMRWDRRAERFMEVWYATLNHESSGSGLWLRYTITAPTASSGRPAGCALWAFHFDPDRKRSFAGRADYPIDRLGSANGRDDGALVRIGDAWLSENHLEGEVPIGGRSLAWSLDFEPADRCYQHLPPMLRQWVARRFSTVCSPNLAVPFTGTVELDGETMGYEAEPGAQSHRWGQRNSHSWAWAHCSPWEGGDDAVFEGVVARAAARAPSLAFLYLRYAGEDFVFNGMRPALRAKSRFEFPTWAFSSHDGRWKIAGASRARVDDTVQVRYEDPDGSYRHCANSEIADMAIEVYRRAGGAWRHDGSLTAMQTADLEFGRRAPFAELPVAF